jgi:hypothetical protein
MTQYEHLWNEVANLLTKLSKEDNVSYRVKATPESVNTKLSNLKT